MKFNYAFSDTCSEATGLVIIIDVLRAFSNAAYAFAAGADVIYLVSTVEQALVFKGLDPTILAMGEVNGLPPTGFDFGNSPTQTLSLDLRGRTLVQRTGAGTQGAVRSVNAAAMLAASFVVAGATVKFVRHMAPDQLTFVITGGRENDEDLACAQYLEALLNGQHPAQQPYIKRVHESKDAESHLDVKNFEFPESDLDLCTQIDRFDFAMPIIRKNGLLTMHAMNP